MAPFSYIVMRDEQHTEGSLRLERGLFAFPDGKLEQLLKMTRLNAKKAARTGEASLTISGSADTALTVLDDHWQHVQEEFSDINEEAAYYYFAKTGKTYGAELEKFQRHASIALSSLLLEHRITDAEIASGELRKENYPLTTVSRRMDSMREWSADAGIMLDPFEEAIDALSTRTYENADKFDDILNGYTEEEDEEKKTQDLQLATGDDGEGKDWERVDEDFDESQMEEVSEEELSASDDNDEREPWQDESPRNLESWEDDDFDPDDQRDDHLRAELEDYINYMVDFTNVANQLWMNAVTRLVDGGHVEIEEDKIYEMEIIRQHTQEAYDIFKAHAQSMGISAYEMQPVFERFEDPKKGTQAMMDKIIRMASKPKRLETAIQKRLATRSDREAAQQEQELAPQHEESSPPEGGQEVRSSEYKNGNIGLTREVFMEDGGKLRMELGMWIEPEKELLKAVEWQFNVKGKPDTHLSNMDAYWDKLCEELDIIARQSRAYGQIKSRGSNDKGDTCTQLTAAHLAYNLLKQPFSDRAFGADDRSEDMPPLTSVNQRFKAVRQSGDTMGMSLDSYERALMRLSTDMHTAMSDYDDIRLGVEGQSPQTTGGDEGMYPLGDAHDDKQGWEPGDSDEWKEGREDLIETEWSKNHDKEESEHNERRNILVTELLDQLNGFMGAADQIWMHAATQLSKGENVSIPEKQLETLRYWMQETDAAYTTLKESTENMPDNFKLHDIFEGMEDEKTGFMPQMQKIVSVAARPDLLEDTIQKGLPRQHKK